MMLRFSLSRALARRATPARAARAPASLAYSSTAARPAEVFGKPVRISPELRRVLDPDGGDGGDGGVGGEAMTMARTDVSKKLWVYIKRHDLQDPDDGRKIVNDQAMRDVFECDEMTMFEMVKLVQKHLD